MLLYDCVYINFCQLSQFLNIEKLLNTDPVSQLGMSKNPTTRFYSEATKREKKIPQKLQLKINEPATKNKLKNLLPELRGFKFVTTLFLEFKEDRK